MTPLLTVYSKHVDKRDFTSLIVHSFFLSNRPFFRSMDLLRGAGNRRRDGRRIDFDPEGGGGESFRGSSQSDADGENSLCVQVNRMHLSTRSVLNIRALVNKIFSFLDCLSLSRSACVSMALSHWTCEDRLWSNLLQVQYGDLLSSHMVAPKALYRKCFAADQAIYSRNPFTYEFSRVLYEGQYTPLTIAFDHRYFMSGHIDSTIKIWRAPPAGENINNTVHALNEV